jgi:hypothetical protein
MATEAPLPHTASKQGASPSPFKPSCPGMYVTSVLKADYVERDYDETVYTPAQCQSLAFKVEVHLSTAFVTASSRWVVPGAMLSAKGAVCAFACPLDPGACVTSISATMKKKRIASCVVPVAATSGFRGKRFGRNDAEVGLVRTFGTLSAVIFLQSPCTVMCVSWRLFGPVCKSEEQTGAIAPSLARHELY